MSFLHFPGIVCFPGVVPRQPVLIYNGVAKLSLHHKAFGIPCQELWQKNMKFSEI